MQLSSIVRTTQKIVTDNSPAILTGFAVVGAVTTAFLAGKTSWHIATWVKEEEHKHQIVVTPKEAFKKYWPDYIPAVVTGTGTVVCIIAAHQIGSRRTAALAAAYSLSEKAFDEYREKIVDKLGPKREEKARDELAQERIDKHPVSTSEVVITGNGDVLCYETYTGRYFTNNMESIRAAENTVNKKVLDYGYASLTEFFDEIGLSGTTVSEEVGFNYDNMCKLHISTCLTDDNRPALAIGYYVVPVRQYFRHNPTI